MIKQSEFERAIFQTFWKQEGCAKFLFFELETSNFVYFFGRLQKQKNIKGGDPYKMYNIKFVQSF